MVSKYNKLFTTVEPLNQESITVLVEYLEGGDKRLIAIRSLRGEYASMDEYLKAKNPQEDPTILWSILSLTPSSAQQLVDALKGALQAAQES